MIHLLNRGKITQPRFKWDVTLEDAMCLLRKGYANEVMSRTGKSDIQIENIEQIARYLISEQKKIGMIFCGRYGNGKTTMMYAIRQITLALYDCDMCAYEGMRIITAKDIVKNNSDAVIDTIKKSNLLGIDDLGEEPTELIDYGNVRNPMIDILEYRYQMQLPTIITTNLISKEIRAKYGSRIADRFNEALEVFIFKKDSYRK